MTDPRLLQARTDAEAGRAWHAMEGLRHILQRDPANADALALSGAVLTNIFAKGSEAYRGGRLGEAVCCFVLLAEYGAPRESFRANCEALVSMILQRAMEDANAGRGGDAKRACCLLLILDPAISQAHLLVGQFERGADGDGAVAAMSIARGLLLAPGTDHADQLRDIALQAGIRALAEWLGRDRPAAPLLAALVRLCPPGQTAALARCRGMTLQAEGWRGDGRTEARRQAAAAAMHWLGDLRQERQRYREAFEAHGQGFDLWNSPIGLERKAQAQQYLVIEALLESLKGFAYAYIYDMDRQAAARASFDSLSATAERLLEAPGIDSWTRTQRWTTLLGLRSLVGYAAALGRNPVLPLSGNPFAEGAAPAVPAEPASRRIFDCCTFFNEAEILEVRLAELYDVVERFVVVEATHTHSGEPKPLSFGDHHERFRPYMDKIRYVVVDELIGTFSWQREAYQRDAILRGLDGCRDDDMVIVSDVDEILRREVVERLRGGGPAFDTVFTAELDLFFYRLNYRFARNWRAAGAAPFRFIRQTGPNAVRYLAKQDIGHLIRDAGWHFSWMGDLKRFAAKLNAYAHQEHAQSFGEGNMAGVASFLDGGGALPEGAPGAREEYEVVAVDRHPRLVRDNLDRFRTTGWLR
ncbi:hypothetical protein J2848_005792 [Azospirillum lipoferum]|uniref:Glycosyltransferase family 17 n=1 Tax=Azospirillum lipoferum TaxID=193 RepID=A0A5A9GJG2_AZOLI|nr:MULTISPECIES: hypothetical protein [Azospirillum]KAA0593844.1 hypothetical protein FZ942_23495 [Azospirillum lipoferum]MCP1614089.1 hypothetical protein [Azospirillum lipoferum]MDW5536778.1 hypothetical protein [Azospirillum sp. NL1]